VEAYGGRNLLDLATARALCSVKSPVSAARLLAGVHPREQSVRGQQSDAALHITLKSLGAFTKSSTPRTRVDSRQSITRAARRPRVYFMNTRSTTFEASPCRSAPSSKTVPVRQRGQRLDQHQISRRADAQAHETTRRINCSFTKWTINAGRYLDGARLRRWRRRRVDLLVATAVSGQYRASNPLVFSRLVWVAPTFGSRDCSQLAAIRRLPVATETAALVRVACAARTENNAVDLQLFQTATACRPSGSAWYCRPACVSAQIARLAPIG